MGHHFSLLSLVGYLAQSGPNLTFSLLKAHVFYGLEIFTRVNGLFLLGAQIMFSPVKGPLWAHAYQKNMKAYADLGPDIFSGLHANFGPESFLSQLEWARRILACWAPMKLSAKYITKINLHYTKITS